MTAGAGVITWRACWACRWKTPVSIPASPGSSWPPVIDSAMMRRISSGLPPSCARLVGSMPISRRIRSETPLRTTMKGWKRTLDHCSGRAARRAMFSAAPSTASFGTSSPNTMWMDVMTR